MTQWTAAGAFSKDAGTDFDARCTLGKAGYGIGDVGLVLSTLDRIGDDDPQAWFDQWSATARGLADRADTAAAAGRVRTASWAYLAASQYFATALGALDGLADQSVLTPTFAAQLRCWQGYIDSSAGAFVRVDVPYEGSTLPGYLLRPDASGTRRPTLVVTNGSDGSLAGLVADGGVADALARGWNAFVYDGPGQQSMLFQQGVPFRPDWEAVLTPVVDTLVARGDVDPGALFAVGISQAGYWLPRALAFEHRFVAAVADPGVFDLSTSWFAHLPPEMIALIDSGDKDTFNGIMAQLDQDPDAARVFAFRARPYGISDPFDLFTEVRRYTLAGVVEQIRTPLLLTDPQDEQFWPGQSRPLYDALTGEKEILEFAAEQGANWHCQPMGRHLTNTQALDWLADHLSGR
ncbi:MAG TPA: dipeptidyl aminopeptidase [Nakamurella sp.]|jgi:hypothetical protein